jgi:hypothetical protein
MGNTNELSFSISGRSTWPTTTVVKACSDSPLSLDDKRVGRLLLLLQQLQESAGRLAALPRPELDEIVSSAVRLCGFVNPIEEREVVTTVLGALEIEDSVLESS